MGILSSLISFLIYGNTKQNFNIMAAQLQSEKVKGGGIGLADSVLAGPIYQEGSKYFSANQKSNAWVKNRDGVQSLEYFESLKAQ